MVAGRQLPTTEAMLRSRFSLETIGGRLARAMCEEEKTVLAFKQRRAFVDGLVPLGRSEVTK